MKLCERARFALLRNSISWRSFSSSSSSRDQRLYQRLSPVGDPNASVVPILDQWVREGNSVDQIDLQKIIRELRSYKRFNHALQISQWMSDKRYMALSAKDMAARLDLIARVHGIDKAQEYFDNIPVKVKRFEVHAALLCVYAREGYAKKAEALMDRIRVELKFHSALCHNVMMSMYNRLGEHKKLNSVASEMERDGIAFDVYSYSILLGSHASLSDTEGMTRIVKEVEANHGSALDWEFYSTAANGFIKVGSMDKAYEMLKKLENHLWKTKKRALGFYFLLGAYGQIGNKDELYHVWDIFKRHNKIYNKGYTKMMSSLLDLGDVEGAERVFREWEESTGLSYDHSVPDLLIGAYCEKGLPGKARELVEKQEAKGVRFELNLWTVLAGRYLENGLIHWAIGALKKAIPISSEPENDALSGCLEYLEGNRGDIKGAQNLVELLGNRGVFSEVAREKFMDHVKKAEKQVMSK